MSEFWMWFMAPIGVFLGSLALLGVVLCCFISATLVYVGWQAWKSRGCEHPEVNETRACEAICRRCGKNLGFIGTWREKQKEAAK